MYGFLEGSVCYLWDQFDSAHPIKWLTFEWGLLSLEDLLGKELVDPIKYRI